MKTNTAIARPAREGHQHQRQPQQALRGIHETLYDLWCEGGRELLRRVMEEKPVAFMQAIDALVPKEFAVDEETAGGFAAVWRALGQASSKSQED
jgi:hypothetical protein